MLEMIFSIGILIMAVSTILALSFSNAAGQKESEYQVIANNLAREGVEIVRNQRDSNWLAGRAWDEGLLAGSYIADFNSASNLWQLISLSGNVSNIIYLSNDGVYSHNHTGQVTNYKRWLEIRSICLNLTVTNAGQESIKTACTANSEKKIGLRVRSNVSWVEKNRNRLVTLEDLLYDWK